MIASKNDKRIIKDKIDQCVKEGHFINKKVLIFGCTIYARDIRDCLRRHGIEIDAILDNNMKKVGMTCLGVPVCLPEAHFGQDTNNTVVIICSKYFREMKEQLLALGCGDMIMIAVEESREKEDDSLETLKNSLTYVKKGYRIYQQIKEKYSKEHWLFLCPYPGTGDIYMAGVYLDAYLGKKCIKQYIMVVSSKSCKEVALLFDLENVEVVSMDDMQLMLKAWEFFGNKKMMIKPLLYWGWRTKRYLYADEYPQITFNEMFLYDVFDLPEHTEKRQISVDFRSTYAKELFRKLELQPHKTVVIAPYAGSFVSEMDMGFWSDIVLKLKQKGWTVATNCCGDQELPVLGSVPIFFPYKEAIQVLEYAGAFVALRSGLCDIVSQARCKMIILYESGFNAARYEYFSLDKMGLNPDVLEFIYEKETESYIKKKIIEAIG